MGLFNKIKDAVNNAKEQVVEQIIQKQEEEARKKEEAKRKQEEANRFNPDGKNLQWFGSEDGIATFKEYITPQNYLLEETLKKEYDESEYSAEYSFGVYASVVHKKEKIPSIYFRKLAEAIGAPALEYVGPLDLVKNVLSIQAKPFYIDDDGEPQAIEPDFLPEEIVSTEKNPALNFVKNFNCFKLEDDTQGSGDDKWNLWSSILIWLGVHSGSEKEIISKNPWIFSKETYFNDLGTVRKPKGFYKKCIELASCEEYKTYFTEKYNECE